MIRVLLPSILFLASTQCLLGQMWNGIDTLYGNEWIKFDQSYFKIEIAEDGIYRLDQSELLSQGIPVGIISGSQYQLFWMGEEIPVYVSTDNPLGSSDYIEFYGQKNRSELDRFLFRAPDEELLNPEYSLVTDTSTYFLTWKPSGSGPGKRYMSLDSDFNNLPEKEPWAWASSEIVFSEKFIKKYELVSGQALQFSHYDVAEGFGSLGMNDFLGSGNTTQTVTLEIEKVFSGGPESVVQTRFASGLNTHHQTISVGGEKRYEELFTGFSVKNAQFSLPTNTLTNNGSLDILYEGLASDRDKQSIAFTRLTYPRSLNFGGASYAEISLNGSSAKRYLEIEEFNIAGDIPVLYDKTNGLRVQGEIDGNILKFTLPVYAQNRSLVLINSNNASKSVASISPTTFVDYTSLDKSFVFISHPKLYDDGNGNNYIQDYADYRASNEGGSFSPQIIDIDQLYDQFAYGIKRHPLSIRNFAHFIKKNWPALEYIFLIGKGREYINIRQTVALAEAQETTFFIPSFGYPASDNLLFSNQGNHTPIVPIGRIAATDPNQVRIYLDKVKAFDETSRNQPQTIEGKAWMKRVIHLGGGSSNSEQTLIKSHLSNLENTLTNFPFGANVKSFFKTSLDPIQTSQTEQIFSEVNEGSSMITFFGHSAPGRFDFNIDNPENYENYGKFPLILSLGCYSGNIFTSSQSISERFSFYEDRAAIAFGASRGVGFISTLGNFANIFYQRIGGITYGEGIGNALMKTLANYSPSSSIYTQTLLEQFTLHGDPAIQLHPNEGPDYVVDLSSVVIDPQVVSIRSDSFSIQFDVMNLGLNVSNDLDIEISQQLPNGTIRALKRFNTNAPSYRSTITEKLPTIGQKSTGLNKIYIKVDGEDKIEEWPKPSAELNNELVQITGEKGIPLYIIDNSAQPIFPPSYGVISTPNIKLKASTTDALANNQKYLMEIDTTPSFNSMIKQSFESIQGGGVIRWEPTIALMDSAVYYWRISPDSTNAEIGYNWTSSSFSYIPNSPNGWRQGHYGQWRESNLTSIEIDENQRFTFNKNFKDIRIRNKTYESNLRPEGFVNGKRWSDFFRWELHESVNIVVVDSIGRIWFNFKPGEYGSVNNTATRIASYPFAVETPEDRSNVINFIENVIPDNHWVIFYTVMRNNTLDLNIDEWAADSILFGGKNIFNVLETQGATQVRSLTTGMVPYIYAFKKNQGKLKEEIASFADEEINLELAIPGFWVEGVFSSPFIGPGTSWENLTWSHAPLESSDSVSIKLLGRTSTGQIDTLINNLTSFDTSLSWINPEQYPFLQLYFYAEDRVNTTCPQLRNWFIQYEGIPDIAINPNDQFEFYNDTIQQGDILRLSFSIENMSTYDVDSLLVQYKITDRNNRTIEERKKLSPLSKESNIQTSFIKDTRSLMGPQTISIELNPLNNPRELHIFNNIARKSFYVETDLANPSLDVTFDGTHILDGDIISSKPEIVITLEDENTFLLLNDTSSYSIGLQNPDGSSRLIPIAEMEYFPATNSDNNKATLVWHPDLDASGTYELAIRAKDISNNPSGAFDYQISFNVFTENSISNILNYPNPFSTSTHFVYTLTGDQPPSFFMIQIMTVSGRIVRELTESDLGQLKIGTHQTEYAWDGTDEFGDQLANGVYLYRIVARDENGKAFENYTSSVDRFFKKGLGKMVILK